MPLDINTLLLDYNGSAMAVAGHAEWGFVPEDWYIAIPKNSTIPDKPTIGASQFGASLNEVAFIKANYHQVRNSAGSNEVALFVAMLRAHLVRNGVLALSMGHRSVIEDEYVLKDPANANWDDGANDIPAIPTSREIAKFIKHHGSTFVHQMVYVFSARGHHWDPAYNDLYERLKRACFISGNPGFSIPSNEILYRLAVHGFGIKPLTDLTLHDRASGGMAAAMFLRFDPSPPIAGMAHITTLNATLNSMSQEAWWGTFYAKFSDSVDAIRGETKTVHQHGYEYHVAAKVFGHNVRRTASADSVNAFNLLCQYALGYIDHLGRRHSLSGQQAISQKSGGPRGIAEAFARACDKFGRPSVDVPSMVEFLRGV